MKKMSALEIIQILRSIEVLSIEDKELDVRFKGDVYYSSIHSFIPGSFTRELLELIEDAMIDGKESNND